MAGQRNYFSKTNTKYRNVRSGSYDSRKEEKRANDLKVLEKLGEITELKEQVTFELIPSQYEVVGGKKVCIERGLKYIADFVYIKNDQVVVEDTKGFKTKDYIIKRKLMLFIHKIKITEI